MRFPVWSLAALFASVGSHCLAQSPYPSVTEIMARYDADQDGTLTLQEISKSQYARQFPRWDKNKDDKVSSKEIVTFRRQFGIAADGSLIKAPQAALSIPDISMLPRIDRTKRPTRQAAKNSAFLLRTEHHAVDGTKYVILTDHTSRGYLEPLMRLAMHHDGSIIKVDDLASLYSHREEFDRVRAQLRSRNAKFVAIAPRMESFRENMVLAMWELLSTIDADSQIDVFPGFLLASTEESFAKLIDQSIHFESYDLDGVRPMAISQVQRASEMRSLQKAGILRKQFAKSGLKTPVVAIYGHEAAGAGKLPGDHVWNLKTPGKRNFVKEFPPSVDLAMKQATLVVMHGHGIPGMSCSVDVDGLPDDLSGKIMMSGSCFSASPTRSDLPQLGRAPGGYTVSQREAFVIRAIDNGAIVGFGHQRLSSGFPHLYPVLEAWMMGETVGGAFQQLLNALIDLQQTKPGHFLISEDQKNANRFPQNSLLYVILGDPALQPMKLLSEVKQQD